MCELVSDDMKGRSSWGEWANGFVEVSVRIITQRCDVGKKVYTIYTVGDRSN